MSKAARCQNPGCKNLLVERRGSKEECPACYMRRYRNGGVATPPPPPTVDRAKVAGYVPLKLARAVERAAKVRGWSESRLVEDALVAYLKVLL